MVGCFLDTLHTAHVLKFDVLEFFAVKHECGSAQSRFHNAARCAENDACAGVFANDVVVKLLIGKFCKADTCALDELGKFSCRKNGVNVFESVDGKFFSVLFKLLCGARHDGHDKHIFGLDAVALRIVGFEDCAEHFVRRFARGKVIELIAIVILRIVYPAGRTGRNHGKHAAVFDAIEKFVCLLHNRKVCAEIGVKHFLESESAQSRNHFSGYESADRHIEFFTECGSHCGSGLNDDVFALSECLVNLVYFTHFHECAGGANAYALTAKDARNVGKTSVLSGSDDGFETSLLEAENGKSVRALASFDTSAAKNAF